MATKNNIGVISWTYNDPVVWHEFVMDASKKAHAAGVKTLYKSAFYIEKEPVDELLNLIDIFSISLKSLDSSFYSKITKGKLEPVLERIKQVFHSGKHLELSQLVVTGLNDKMEDIRKTIEWVLKELSPEVPLHFVAFHPAYKYLNVPRTPISTLIQARDLALSMGIKNCYLGNVYEEGVSDSYCNECGHTQVERYGLSARTTGIDLEGNCKNCGKPSLIVDPHYTDQQEACSDLSNIENKSSFEWTEEVKSVHVELQGDPNQPVNIQVQHNPEGKIRLYRLGEGVTRIIVARSSQSETGVQITSDQNSSLNIFPVLDRAHFPVSL